MLRKKRPSQHVPPTISNPSPSAALAASQAFLKTSNSNASLSSAAAAAALRSHTPPPTNPANIQTKRMVRRASVSSQGSAVPSRAESPARPGLHRSNSSGSMTERTFRSSSPGGSINGGDGNRIRSDPDAPPVPALPKTINARAPAHNRASSLEPQAKRMLSPTPTGRGARNGSLDAANRNPRQPRDGAPVVPRISTASPDAAETAAKRSSVNFSRPMSPTNSSPQASPVVRQGRSGWFTGPVTSGGEARQTVHDQYRVPSAGTVGDIETSQVSGTVQNAANAPVKTNTKVTRPEGQRLTQAINNIDRNKQTMVYDPASRTMRPLSEMPPPIYEPVREQSAVPAITTSLAQKTSVGVSPTVGKTPTFRQRPASGLSKQPSIVRERREEEEEAEAAVCPTPRFVAQTQTQQQRAMTPQHKHTRSVSLEPDSPSTEGSQSLSPPRQARFSAVLAQDGLRHEPPPRSLSPAKPALKHSPASSVRTASPATHFAQQSRKGSITSTDGFEDPAAIKARKKAARVSFGDELPVQIMPDNKPVSPSPEARTQPIFDDENFSMTPRPVLPSFGSVRGRGKASGSASEDSSVKPIPADRVPQRSALVNSSTSATAPGNESSGDLALGGIIREDLVARAALLDSDIGKQGDKTQPLPPQVTSVDGSGYVSDDSEAGARRAAAAIAGAKPVATKTDTEIADGTVKESSAAEAVPDIALQPATPGSADEGNRESFQLHMPGGAEDVWAADSGSSREAAAAAPAAPAETHAAQKAASEEDTAVTDSAPTEPLVREDVVAGAKPAMRPRHRRKISADPSERTESDDESIYNDAEEEISDREGFASLNAIVESPVQTSKAAPNGEPDAVANLAQAEETPGTELDTTDWEQSKEYWARLSESRKLELERQARPEAFESETEPEIQAEPAQPTSTGETIMQGVEKVLPAAAVASVASAVGASTPATQGTKQGPRSALKQSQPQPRAASVDRPIQLRRSMRGPPEPMQQQHSRQGSDPDSHHLRSSMRGTKPAPTRPVSSSGGLQSSRYASPQRTTQQQRTAAAAAAAFAPAGAEQQQRRAPRTMSTPGTRDSAYNDRTARQFGLTRRGSDASDSSFKRSRRAPSSVMSDGGYSMRRSLRGSGEPAAPQRATAARAAQGRAGSMTRRQSPPRPATATTDLPAGRARRFSLRSLSPSGSLLGARRRRGNSIDFDSRPQPPQHQRTRSDIGRPGPPPAAVQRAVVAIPPPTMKPRSTVQPRQKFQSRFADSDDSDDEPAARRPFRSRFVDSDDDDDDEEPAYLPPVRGIPRRTGEADNESTDLEEEGSGTSPQAARTTRGTAAGAAQEGSALAAGSMRNGNVSGLQDSKHAPMQQQPPAAGEITPLVTTPKKEKRRFFSIRGMRRSSSVPPKASARLASANDAPPLPALKPTQQAGPKLQRRNTPQHVLQRVESGVASGNWPLHASSLETSPVADGNADAAARVEPMMTRPDVGQRRNTVDGLSDRSLGARFDEDNVERTGGGGEGKALAAALGGDSKGIYSARTGKKKKFPMLRRAFGLHD